MDSEKTLFSKKNIKILKTSTTLERVIVILAMISGVMGFYFVLSNINTVVSSTVRKDIEFAARLSMLEKIKKKYSISAKLYKEAKVSLYEDEYKPIEVNLKPFFIKFHITLRENLKYFMNLKKLNSFRMFDNLDRSIVNSLGKCIKSVKYEPSKDSLPRNS